MTCVQITQRLPNINEEYQIPSECHAINGHAEQAKVGQFCFPWPDLVLEAQNAHKIVFFSGEFIENPLAREFTTTFKMS